MQTILVGKNEAGQRLDKLLKKLLSKAPQSFIYKMLRKKNITLNDKRAEGIERLEQGDKIKLFFSEDTFARFSGEEKNEVKRAGDKKLSDAFCDMIVYEDENVILIRKPVGILSQKAVEKDISLIEYLTEYLLDTGSLNETKLKTFKPGICNRLDRNTGGLVVAGKSLVGLQVMSEIFRKRDISKYYMCIVSGRVNQPAVIKGYLRKNESDNTVFVINSLPEDKNSEEYVSIETEYRPIKYAKNYTLLEVKLITGKTHQIRAHLAGIGHPIAGDIKYGDKKVNDTVRKDYGVRYQLLFAYRIMFPKMESELTELSERDFTLELPREFFLQP